MSNIVNTNDTYSTDASLLKMVAESGILDKKTPTKGQQSLLKGKSTLSGKTKQPSESVANKLSGSIGIDHKVSQKGAEKVLNVKIANSDTTVQFTAKQKNDSFEADVTATMKAFGVPFEVKHKTPKNVTSATFKDVPIFDKGKVKVTGTAGITYSGITNKAQIIDTVKADYKANDSVNASLSYDDLKNKVTADIKLKSGEKHTLIAKHQRSTEDSNDYKSLLKLSSDWGDYSTTESYVNSKSDDVIKLAVEAGIMKSGNTSISVSAFGDYSARNDINNDLGASLNVKYKF